MASVTLEERVAAVEQERAQLKQELKVERETSSLPWWEKVAGTFSESEHYDEAMRLGREYRESLRPMKENQLSL